MQMQANNQPAHFFASGAYDQCIIPEEDSNQLISLDVEDDEGDPFDLMGDGVGDEDDGGENENENDHSGNSGSHRNHHSLPPAVQEAYEKHIQYLKQMSGNKPKPHLYAVHQTFWLPQKSNFFIINGSSKPWPLQLYGHRWFYWDPDYLVEGGLQCPNCKAHLHHHGFTRPRRVVDLHDVFYMIGQCHRCPKCRNPDSNNHSITFNSWDSRIVESLQHV